MFIGILISDMTRLAGTERSVANLAALLTHQGHEVVICSVYSAAGGSAYPLPPEVRLLHGGLTFAAGETLLTKLRRKAAFLKLLRSRHFDVLIGTEVSFNILLPLARAGKVIGCEHMNYGFAPARLRLLRRLFYPRLDAVVLLTAGDGARYSFVPASRRFIIPNMLPFAVPPALPHESREILAVGRLTRQKGFDLLIAAAGRIAERHPDWHLTIVGAGEDREALLAQIQQRGLTEFISLEPPVSDLTPYYRRAAVYAMSSRWEGLPMVLLEAQAFGLPEVSFNCPEGPSEVIHDGRDGFLVPPENPDALADKINQLIEHPELRAAFSAAARQAAGNYTESAVAPLWAALLAKLNQEQ